MDFQPTNLFIRGASLGALLKLQAPVTMYKYLNRRFHQAIIDDADEARRLPPPIYLTTYRFYSPREALRALAIPGPAPTHVLEIHLQAGAELQGPAFVNPLVPSAVQALPWEHRHGNGVEFLLLTALSQEALAVSALQDRGAEE